MEEKGKNEKKFRGEIVKKDNILNEGIYTLDTAEKYKLLLLMISQISTKDSLPSTPEEIANRIYSFYIDDYAELKKVKDKYSFEDYISKMVIYLKDKSAITIKTENSIRTIWIFQEVDFQRDKKGWKVLFRFSYSIAKYLFELKEKFIAYHIRNIMPMRSKYSIRLYELLKQYEKIGERTFEINEFREKIGTRIYIIDPKTREKKLLQDDYKKFQDLKKRVIGKAVQEINEFSDIEIEDVEYIRQGRGGKVRYITFHFKSKINFNFQKVEEVKEKVEADKNEVLNNKEKEMPIVMEITWTNIGELRRLYKSKIREIVDYIRQLKDTKVRGKKDLTINNLSENEILFLLINANYDFFDEEMVVSMIKKAITNKKIKNIMGFLIKTLGIDMEKAKFKELTLTSKKIDEKLFKEKLEKMMVEGKPARDYLRHYFNEVVKPAYSRGEISKEFALFLRESFEIAVIDELSNEIYIPVSNELYKDWLESNFLEDIKSFLKERFNVKDVLVELVE